MVDHCHCYHLPIYHTLFYQEEISIGPTDLFQKPYKTYPGGAWALYKYRLFFGRPRGTASPDPRNLTATVYLLFFPSRNTHLFVIMPSAAVSQWLGCCEGSQGLNEPPWAPTHPPSHPPPTQEKSTHPPWPTHPPTHPLSQANQDREYA